MKFTTLFKSAAALLMGAVMFSCTPNENGDGDGDGTGTGTGAGKEELNENLEFTLELVAEDLDTDSAKIKVSHNGQKTDTWYGFVTTETDIDDAILDEVEGLLQEDGTIASTKLKKSTSTNVNLRELEPATDYTYVVFGLSEKGTVYGIPESLEFTTKSEFTGLTETQDWTIAYEGRNEERKELFSIDCDDNSIYFFDIVDEYIITGEDGTLYLNDYLLMMVDETAYFLENGVTVEKMLEVGYLQEGPGVLGTARMASGTYYAYAIGYNEDGTPTGKYSAVKFDIEEEEATEDYLKWVGEYTFTGANNISYDIILTPYDNNYMYAVAGWETGEFLAADNDGNGQPDGVDFNNAFTDYVPLFPAYFNEGKLEFYEWSPIINFELQGSEVMLGLYAWGVYQGESTVLLTDGGLIATGTTTDNGETGTLTGGKTSTNDGTEIDMKSMGYIAMSTDYKSYWYFNDPLEFPINMVKKADDGNSQQSMAPRRNIKLKNNKEFRTMIHPERAIKKVF